MIKLSSNLDFNFDIASVMIITDCKQLVKRASDQDLFNFKKEAGQTYLHIIAVGAYEGTGFNRNGDCFKEADCKSNHHWFRDSGKFDKIAGIWDGRSVHRHHKNKPESPKYGNVKVAYWNDEMKRIELIVGLDNEKCADILDEQETKGQTNWSMASKQAFDICSWCKHKAANDADRCDHIPNHLGEINKMGEMCGMINPNPRWFEISYVRRPADRIGMSLRTLDKSACVKTANYLSLYPDFYVPEDDHSHILISKKASEKRALITKLAAMEKRVEAVANGSIKDTKDKMIASHGAALNASDKLSDTTLEELRKYEPSKLFKVLADNGIVLGPEEFVKYIFGTDSKHDVDGMKSHLPDIFDSADEGELANDEKFEPSVSNTIPKELKSLISKLTDDHSIFGSPAHCRVMRIIIMGKAPKKLERSKEHSKEAFDKGLAKAYASYKLAALSYLDETNKLDDETLLNAVIQNRQ
jgi:hypothetical protein